MSWVLKKMQKRGLFAKQTIHMLVEAHLSDRRMLAVLYWSGKLFGTPSLRTGVCSSRGCWFTVHQERYTGESQRIWSCTFCMYWCFCSLIGVLNYGARPSTELTDNFGIGQSLLKDLTWWQDLVGIAWGTVIWIHSKVNLRWRMVATIYRTRHDWFSGVLVTHNGGIAIMQQSIVLIPQNSKSNSVTHWWESKYYSTDFFNIIAILRHILSLYISIATLSMTVVQCVC